jgi:hypothetical protein
MPEKEKRKIFQTLFRPKNMSKKSKKNKFQKPYLEVSNSIRDGIRAFFRLSPKRKNQFFFQMSQTARLEILCCVMVLKVFFKKRNFLARKNSTAMDNQKPCVLILQPSQPLAWLA